MLAVKDAVRENHAIERRTDIPNPYNQPTNVSNPPQNIDEFGRADPREPIIRFPGVKNLERRGEARKRTLFERQFNDQKVDFDLDGDGATSQHEYLLAAMAHVTKDMGPEERKKKMYEMEGRLKDKYFMRELEGSFQKRGRLMARSGEILQDNAQDPPRYPADKPPPAHESRTEMLMDRLAEARNTAAQTAKFKKFMVPQPPAYPVGSGDFNSKDDLGNDLKITSIKDKQERNHQIARMHNGLDPKMGPIDDVRDRMCGQELPLTWQVDPEFKTQTAMYEARKLANVADLKGKRVANETSRITPRTAKAVRDENVYRYNFPDPTGQTRSQLLRQRKQEFCEYNMAHFRDFGTLQYPRYSDQTVPYWKLGHMGTMPKRGDVGAMLPEREPRKPVQAVSPERTTFKRLGTDGLPETVGGRPLLSSIENFGDMTTRRQQEVKHPFGKNPDLGAARAMEQMLNMKRAEHTSDVICRQMGSGYFGPR